MPKIGLMLVVSLVALRKESVDRNRLVAGSLSMIGVALRKESVDRNEGVIAIKDYSPWSLSARRAWIEIPDVSSKIWYCGVALRKESVDRNTNFFPVSLFDLPSLSARRAWIEIGLNFARKIRYVSLSARRAWIEIDFPKLYKALSHVALRKESVDRNRHYRDDVSD